MDFDYLTVFSTTSLVLFSSPPPNQLLTPTPICLPLHTLVDDDQQTAWFLVDHMLKASRTRELEHAAELQAWDQIVRAKRFAHSLGMWFSTANRVTESELKDLAASHGLEYRRMEDPHYRLYLRSHVHAASLEHRDGTPTSDATAPAVLV